MSLTDIQKTEFEELAKPLMKFLEKNTHPHTSIIITNNRAELLEGLLCFSSNEFIRD